MHILSALSSQRWDKLAGTGGIEQHFHQAQPEDYKPAHLLRIKLLPASVAPTTLSIKLGTAEAGPLVLTLYGDLRLK